MAKRASMRNLDEIMNLDKFDERWSKPDEYQGITLILKDVTNRSGVRGEYMVMTVVIEETGDEVFISTGASQPMMVTKAWKESGGEAVRFCFVKDGDRILMKRPVD